MNDSEVARLNKKMIQKLYDIQAHKQLMGERITLNDISRELAESEELKLFMDKMLKKKKNLNGMNLNIRIDGDFI